MNPPNSPKTGTHWADQQGRKVFFYSRNPKAKSVIWHPRFYFWYRTSADALKAKTHWETNHRILFPEDVAKLKAIVQDEEKLNRAERTCPPRHRQRDLFTEARV